MNGAGKKVVVVTNSSSYEPRAEWVGELFKQQGAQVLWVETDLFRFYPQRESKKGAECT